MWRRKNLKLVGQPSKQRWKCTPEELQKACYFLHFLNASGQVNLAQWRITTISRQNLRSPLWGKWQKNKIRRFSELQYHATSVQKRRIFKKSSGLPKFVWTSITIARRAGNIVDMWRDTYPSQNISLWLRAFDPIFFTFYNNTYHNRYPRICYNRSSDVYLHSRGRYHRGEDGP